MKLTGIGIGNYRSIGAEPVWIDLTKKINIIIGANNSGKSNVIHGLEFIQMKLFGRGSGTWLSPEEYHMRETDNSVLIYAEGEFDEPELASTPPAENMKCWIIGEYRGGSIDKISRTSLDDNGQSEVIRIFEHYIKGVGISYDEDPKVRRIAILLPTLWGILFSQMQQMIGIIPQFRQIVSNESYGIEGKGIVEELARLERPEIDRHDAIKRRKFVAIQKFLRGILHDETLALSVDDSHTDIIVTRGDLYLPLKSFGAGIHELIILATAIFSSEKHILCIEEPEIHLHPRLQKEFLRFLIEETDNRFVITTHAPAFIAPSEDVEIIHVWNKDNCTKSRHIKSDRHALDLLSDLGVCASDILQANSVIWVEGPSDRTYLNRWISLIDSSLRERIDYQVMFYGGRLLSHVTMDGDDPNDTKSLIDLLRINQHSAIVIDSDRKKANDGINDTKSRINEECDASERPCWITDGREIENYIPIKLFKQIFDAEFGEKGVVKFSKYDKIEACLAKAYMNQRKHKYDNAKATYAAMIAPGLTLEDMSSELKGHIQELVTMIKRASANNIEIDNPMH